MSAARRPVSVLIAALGGQGGGVLTEWIVDAATHAGLRAQATSIPGVAQRTGATTYYLEIYPEPPPAGSSPDPVFSLYPMPGALARAAARRLGLRGGHSRGRCRRRAQPGRLQGGHGGRGRRDGTCRPSRQALG